MLYSTNNRYITNVTDYTMNRGNSIHSYIVFDNNLKYNCMITVEDFLLICGGVFIFLYFVTDIIVYCILLNKGYLKYDKVMDDSRKIISSIFYLILIITFIFVVYLEQNNKLDSTINNLVDCINTYFV